MADEPDSLELANGLATALSHLGDPQRAAAAFQRAHQVALQNLRTQRAQMENTMGLHHWQAGDTAEALRDFEQAIADAPDFAEAHYDLGRLQWESNHLTEATEEFKAAIGIQKNYPEALNNLGEAYLRLGKSDLAVQSFQDAIKIRPEFVVAHFNLAMAWSQQGMRKDAEKQFNEVLLLAPNTAEAHIELGLLYAQNDGSLSGRARKELKEGLRLDPALARLVPENLRAQLQ